MKGRETNDRKEKRDAKLLRENSRSARLYSNGENDLAK